MSKQNLSQDQRMIKESKIEYKQWTIEHYQGRMFNAAEISEWNNTYGVKIPDVVFGSAKLSLRYLDFEYAFTAIDAIKSICHTMSSNLKVSAAKIWSQMPYIEQYTKASNFDWTFTANYSGSMKGGILQENASELVLPQHIISNCNDQILNFAIIHFYEDELNDNGTSQFFVKYRLMPNYLFVLSRFWLRVDSIIFKISDTRLFHEFGSNYLIRETVHKEAPWESLKTCIEKDYNSVLDSTKLFNLLPTTFKQVDKILLQPAQFTTH